MSQTKRILIGLALLAIIGGAVLGLEYFRGRATLPSAGQVTLTPGSVPIYLDGVLVTGITPDALQGMEQVSFVDAEEGKPQDGWPLSDVLLVYLPEQSLADTRIMITSSSRGKSAELAWAEVKDRQNMVMFDLSNHGTLKLVSLLERLDTRDEWIQDVDLIEVVTP